LLILVVSILVFLELALRREKGESVMEYRLQFQSLFSWNSLFDFEREMNAVHIEGPVSILVFLELALRHRRS